jgi:hypothetical protein
LIFIISITFITFKTELERVNPNDFETLEWLFPESTMNFEKLTLAYKGFCAYSLSLPNFILLPANPNIGVLQINNNFYVFSSRNAAYAFANSFQKFVILNKFISFI